MIRFNKSRGISSKRLIVLLQESERISQAFYMFCHRSGPAARVILSNHSPLNSRMSFLWGHASSRERPKNSQLPPRRLPETRAPGKRLCHYVRSLTQIPQWRDGSFHLFKWTFFQALTSSRARHWRDDVENFQARLALTFEFSRNLPLRFFFYLFSLFHISTSYLSPFHISYICYYTFLGIWDLSRQPLFRSALFFPPLNSAYIYCHTKKKERKICLTDRSMKLWRSGGIFHEFFFHILPPPEQYIFSREYNASFFSAATVCVYGMLLKNHLFSGR